MDKVRDAVKFVKDLPPEYLLYKDEGCEVAGSCLECPLPKCVFERRGGKRKLQKNRRDREIVRLTIRGKSIKELARKFKVCQRTVRRALKGNSKFETTCPSPLIPLPQGARKMGEGKRRLDSVSSTE